MTNFLRFIGALNAAIWLGSTIFVLIGVPAIFSPRVTDVLTKQYAGLAAQAVLSRFFLVQYCCGTIALLHLAAEWLIAGKRPRRFVTATLVFLLGLALFAGQWIQPRLRAWHYAKYWGPKTEQEQAAKSFAMWHGVSSTANLLVICGLLFYFVRVTGPTEASRFASVGKLRS